MIQLRTQTQSYHSASGTGYPRREQKSKIKKDVVLESFSRDQAKAHYVNREVGDHDECRASAQDW